MAKAKVLTSQEIKRVLVIAETGSNGLIPSLLEPDLLRGIPKATMI